MTEAIKIGVSGEFDSGKTTVIMSTIKLLREEGFVVGGVVLEPVLEGKKKIGYKILDVYKNKSETVALLGDAPKHNIDGFVVNVEKLNEVGIPAIKNAIDSVDIIIVDEIGKMTAESKAFMKSVMSILEEEIHIIISIDKRSRSTYLQGIRSRTDFRVLEVTGINKAILPHKISKFFRNAAKFSSRVSE